MTLTAVMQFFLDFLHAFIMVGCLLGAGLCSMKLFHILRGGNPRAH